ncbi:hypothetical protein AX769_22500 (plasmid) [Frondihabitans sp. PAMC 28766]|uniref:hypothetical protein n=1 Tax=Frondihabitans sp. PAMC 28766 TaxID=1795630 RepID=UPI00078B9B83|nr:hypothetical protein [Frondihabitans sp. PAMC 28766]AMM22905.1 hypothetical protein AX769_22500 [Frondihabitans sp. PAMC 28766]
MSRRTLLVVILAVLSVAAAVVVLVLLHRAAASHPATGPTSAAAATTGTARPAPATARERAFTVADRFCQPGEASDQWQRSLAPVLTGAAQTMFAATKPANVPCEHVDEASGQAIGDQQTSTNAAWQFTAATGGPVTVTLHRDSPHDAWLASYVQPGN